MPSLLVAAVPSARRFTALPCSCCQLIRHASTTSSTTRFTAQSLREHTLAMVQKYDYPNYLATSFYPTQEARYDYLALRAFNVELSNVADSVRSVQLGQIRFQWWRDAVQSLNTASPIPHPTVLALASVAQRRRVSNYHLNRIIDAKQRNMESATYSTLADFVAYAQSTTMPLLLLQMQLLVPSNQMRVDDIPLSTIDHSLSHLATYISIAQLLRSIPYFAGSKRTMVIPRDIASANKVVDEQVFRALPALSGPIIPGSPSANAIENAIPPLQAACEELCTLAEGERSKARATLGLEAPQDDEHAELAQGRKLSSLPIAVSPVFLSAISATNTFTQLTQSHYNPFEPAFNQPQTRNWKLPAQMWWANFRRQV